MNYLQDGRTQPWSWFHNDLIRLYGGEMGPYGIALYMALLVHADHATRQCFPSLSVLATMTGMSRRQVIYNIQKLERLKIIKKTVNKAGGKHSSNTYTILNPVYPPEPRPDPDEIVHHVHQGSAPHSPGVVHHIHQGGAPHSPEQESFNKNHIEQEEEESFPAETPQAPPVDNSPKPQKTQGKNKAEISPDELIESWNEICVPAGLPRITEKGAKNKTFRRKLAARLAENPELAFWQQVVDYCCASAFLRGQNDRGWLVDLYWLVENDRNALKVYEGKYNGKAR